MHSNGLCRGRCARRFAGWRRWRGFRRSRNRIDDIFFQNLPVLAGAVHFGSFKTCLLQRLARCRSRRRCGGCRRWRGRGWLRCLMLRARRRGCSLRRARRRLWRGGRRGLCSPISQGREQRSDGDGRSRLDEDIAKHARSRRRYFDGDLVGFEFDERLVGIDRLSGLLEPLAYGRLRHAFTKRGNANLDRHMSPHTFLITFRARRRRARSAP